LARGRIELREVIFRGVNLLALKSRLTFLRSVMTSLIKANLPYEQIQNGALILLLLRETKTWDELCRRYLDADPDDLANTATITLRDKLDEMCTLGLVAFEDQETERGRKPVGVIEDTGLWSKIRVSFGGMRLSEAAMLSRHSNGMAVAPVFGRPRKPDERIDIFVLMPFNAKMEKLYTSHLKEMGNDLGLIIRRADEIFAPRPFMEKVWDGICAAELIVADCTEKNPNVFYEIGLAHTVGKKVVLITRSERDIPADIKHYDYIPYVYDPEGAEALISRLKAFIKDHFARSPRSDQSSARS